MREEDLDEAVGVVLEKVPAGNLRPVSEEGVGKLLRDAFAGRRPPARHPRSLSGDRRRRDESRRL